MSRLSRGAYTRPIIPAAPAPTLLPATELPRRWSTLVALGGFGSLCLAIGGAVAGAGRRGPAPFFWLPPGRFIEPSGWMLPGLVISCAGLIIMIRVWMRLRRFTLAGLGGVKPLIVLAIVWMLPLVLAPPLASRDVYAYVAYGEMATAGLDPYEDGPRALDDQEVLAPVDPVYADAPSVYGPVFMTVSHAIASVARGNVVASVLLYRLLGVLGLILAAISGWDIARRLGRNPVDAMMLGPLNPVVLYHLVSGAHNEALMLGFLMAGVAIGRRPGLVHVGVVACALSAAIKIPGILGAVFLLWPWAMAAPSHAKRLGRMALGGMETVSVLVLFSVVTGWNWGWLTALAQARNVNAFLSVTQLAGSSFAKAFGLDAEGVLGVLRPAGLAVAALLALWFLIRHPADRVLTLAWSLLIFAMLHPTTQPWYFTWGLLLLAAATSGTRNRTLVGFSAAACFFVPPLGPGLGFALIDGPGYIKTAIGLLILFALTVSPRQAIPARYRSGLAEAGGPVAVLHRGDDDQTIATLLGTHQANSLVCVMNDDSPFADPIAKQLQLGTQIVIAPKDWNWLGRFVIWLARRAFPQRLARLDPLSSTYGLHLDAIDLNRLEPDGNALLLEVLITNPELSVHQLDLPRAQERLALGDAARYVVHLIDLRLRGSLLWSGIAGARWRAAVS